MSDFKSTLEDLIANVTTLTASNADKGQRVATLEAKHAQTMATVANLTRYVEGCCSTEKPTSAPTPPPTSWTYGK